MRIGIFTDSFTPEVNGVVTSLKLFIAEFEKRGHKVFVFAPGRQNSEVLSNKLDIRRFRSILVWGKQVRLSLPIIATESISKLNLDVIHVQTPGPIGMEGMRLGKKLHLPLVFTYHTRVELYAHFYAHLPVRLERGLLELAAKNFYNLYDAIIAPSQGIKKELKNFVRPPIFVIPTGIDIKINKNLAASKNPRKIFKKYGLSTSDVLLITAGRLGKEKNLGFIIDAFQRIKSSCPKAKLLIAGDGPEKTVLQKYARSVARVGDINFLGFLNQPELFSLYRFCRVFLFSSFTETQGLVILEALAMGLPVVALEAVGVEDLLNKNIGGFMVKNNLSSFVQKTILLIDDEHIWQEKKRAALRQAKKFSIQKTAGQVLNLYRKLIRLKKYK